MPQKYLVKKNIDFSLYSEAELKQYQELEQEQKRIDSNYRRKQNYHDEKSLDENISKNGKYSERYETTPSQAQSGLDYLLDKEKEEKMKIWKSELPDLQRSAFEAIHEEGLNASQASKKIGKSDKTVKKHYLIAVKTIYSKLYEYNTGFAWTEQCEKYNKL